MAEFATVAMMAANKIISTKQQDKQRKLSNAQAQAGAQLQHQRQQQAQRKFDQLNKDRLRRAIAASRANAAARGLGGAGGSAAAILDGLLSENEKKRRNFLIDQNFEQSATATQNAFQRKRNLLDQQTAFMGNTMSFAGGFKGRRKSISLLDGRG